MVGKGCTRGHDDQPDGRNAEILGKWVLKPHLHKQQSINQRQHTCHHIASDKNRLIHDKNMQAVQNHHKRIE